MSAPATTPLRRPGGEVAVPAVATVAWLAVATLLFADVAAPAALIVPLLVAVAATAVAVVGFVRRRSAGRPSGALVTAVLSPAIVLAAMTPLFAIVGPVLFAVFGMVAAAGTATLAVLNVRRPHRA